MTRVALGWIGGAGSPAGRRRACAQRAVGVERPVGLDLGVDPQVADPPGLGRQSRRTASVKAAIASGVQSPATGPRGA